MKRFTETQKWDDPWFLELPMEMKLLWQWLCDKCDNAGVIQPSLRLASFHIGYQYPMDTLSKFGERLVDIGDGKWFIPKFIEFQYGNLSRDCKAHNPIFISLEKHGLKGYPKGIHTLQEKEKEKEKERDQEQDSSKGESKHRRPTLAQAKSAAADIGITEAKAEEWWNCREASEWLKGMSGGGTSPVGSNWRADMTTYAKRGVYGSGNGKPARPKQIEEKLTTKAL